MNNITIVIHLEEKLTEELLEKIQEFSLSKNRIFNSIHDKEASKFTEEPVLRVHIE